MSMHTRCTHCEAVFRVTLLQLQSSSGRVRCGVCHDVFDAFVNLRAADPPPSTPSESTAPPDSVAPATPAAEVADCAPVSGTPAARDELPATAPDRDDVRPAEESADADAPAVSSGFPEPELEGLSPETIEALERAADERELPGEGSDALSHEGWPRDEPESYSAPAGDIAVETAEVPPTFPPTPPIVPPSARRPTWPLALATSVASLILAGQAIHQFRTSIATTFPALRPTLEAACGMVGCVVPLPKLPERLVIEASDLGALDPTRPNRVVLATTVRNAAPVAQAYPMLELTLTDARDQVTARKVFEPQEYLDVPPRPDAGIGPDAEFSVRLQLDVGDLEASGYRIYLFHR